MSKSRWEQYKEKNGVTPLDLLNPMTKHSSDELATSRMSICQGCPELIKLTSSLRYKRTTLDLNVLDKNIQDLTTTINKLNKELGK